AGLRCRQARRPLASRGRSYRFARWPPSFSPGRFERPRLPIYLAAVNPSMCRLAGGLGDGIHIHSFHSAKYLREVIHPAVTAGRRASGRSTRDFTVRASTMVVLGDTPEELERNRQAVKQQIAS